MMEFVVDAGQSLCAGAAQGLKEAAKALPGADEVQARMAPLKTADVGAGAVADRDRRVDADAAA